MEVGKGKPQLVEKNPQLLGVILRLEEEVGKGKNIVIVLFFVAVNRNIENRIFWIWNNVMGERRELNPRVVDSQSTALIHLATSAPTPAQVEVSIYDQILSELPYNRLSKRSFFLDYSGKSIVVFRN